MLSDGILSRIEGAAMLNVGSGPSAYAFDYEAADVNGINLAMTPSDFSLEKALLEVYAPHFPRGAALILAVCPFSFGENRANADPARYIRYYPVLPREALDALPPPLPHWDAQVAATADCAHPLFPYGTKTDRSETPSEETLSRRVRSMCEVWKREFGLRDFLDASQAEAHRSSFTRNRQALLELISAARALGLRPWLFLPPLHPSLRAQISDAFFEAFVRDPIRDCPAPLLDYTADPAVTPDMFLGPVFLNAKGAAALTRAVWKTCSK